MFNRSSPTNLNYTVFNYCLSLQFQEIYSVVQSIPVLLIVIINAVSSLMAVAKNALILAAIWSSTSLRTPSYILLAGLAATDFVSGLITYPLFATDMLSTIAENEL